MRGGRQYFSHCVSMHIESVHAVYQGSQSQKYTAVISNIGNTSWKQSLIKSRNSLERQIRKCMLCQRCWPLNFTQSWVCASLKVWWSWRTFVLNLPKKKRLRKELRIYQKIFAQRFLVGCYLGQRFISFLFLFWTCHLAFPPTLSSLINYFNSRVKTIN